MPGRAPILKQKVRALVTRHKVLELIGQGSSVLEIASEMKTSTHSIRRHLHKALETESLFPTNLDGQQVAQLRQVEAEKLARISANLHKASERGTELLACADPDTAVAAVVAVARTAEAAARLSERISKLFGLDQPTKIVEESLRVNLERSEKKITISFDTEALSAPDQSVPGLDIFEGSENNGNGNAITNNPEQLVLNPSADRVAESVSGARTQD
jgi:hypothetical protein